MINHSFQYLIPTKIYFGRGLLGRIGELARKHVGGNKALIVTTAGGSMKKYGYLDKVTSSLREHGYEYVVFARVSTNPTIDVVEEGIRVFGDNSCDLIIGLGGGSAIDVAKAISLAYASNTSVKDLVHGKVKPKLAVPLIAVPTTHGTGTEVDKYAVITDPEAKLKAGIVSPKAYPVLSILDPETTITLPKKLSAGTTMDAFIHSLESMVSYSSNIMTAMYASKSIETIVEYAPKLMSNLRDIESRTMLLWASMLAGIAIDLSRTGILHALEHAVSAYHPEVHHGVGLAVLLKGWVKHILPLIEEDKLNLLARALGVKSRTSEVAEKILWLRKALELELGLRDLGVSRSELKTLVDNAYKYLSVLAENTPGKPGKDIALKILEESYEP